MRDDAEARDLRRAAALHNAGRFAEARRLFERHDSLEAKVGAAFAGWPGSNGTASLDRVEQLGALYPRSALAQLHLGLARFWAGEAGAIEAWREAREVEPDTLYAVRANDLLHPEFAPGLPVFVAAAKPPADLEGRPPAEQLEALRAAADSGRLDAMLLYGIALQRLGRPVSAQRVFDEAARAHPDEAEALAASAVGRYTKERPAGAFSRLGPLTRRFPEAARPCASTSACCSCGSRTSPRRSGSCGSPPRPRRARGSPARPRSTSRRSLRQLRMRVGTARGCHGRSAGSARCNEDPRPKR